MLAISFSFGSHEAYNAPTLSLPGATHHLDVSFDEGEHVYSSPDFELGTIHALRNAPLIGRLSFRYTRDKVNGTDRVTVCGADYESADGMTLMTFPREREDAACFERASGAGFAADEIHHNGVWDTRSPIFPGASRIFKDIARDATRALIDALSACDDIDLAVRTPFPELALEDYKKLCLVLRDGEPVGTLAEVSDTILRSGEDGFEVRDVRSQFGGIGQLPLDRTFANVLGSTGDKVPGGGSWIQLWSASIGRAANTCATFQFPASVTGCVPGASLVGGHIILQATAAQVTPGSNSVSIIPICRAHNNVYFTGAMRARQERSVVLLRNYHNP